MSKKKKEELRIGMVVNHLVVWCVIVLPACLFSVGPERLHYYQLLRGHGWDLVQHEYPFAMMI